MLLTQLHHIMPAILGSAAVLYLWLAVRVSRASTHTSSNAISYFLFLIGTLIAGSAFAIGTTEPNIYGIGRTLSFFSSGFLPIVLYTIYREYTVGRTNPLIIAVLSIVPIASTLLSITNPLHNMIWSAFETAAGTQFSAISDHLWFQQVHKPFAFGLFGYSVLAMASRLPNIARAHRRKISLFLVCAVLPYGVSIATNFLGIGPSDFPLTSLTFVLMLPIYWWASMDLRVYDFTPLAYQTMFDHVRDPIIVLDKSQRIISANQPAQVLLNGSEKSLLGQKLWEDLPEAQAVLNHARNHDLTQTIRMQSDRFFELNSAPLKSPSGRDQGTVVVCRDVTERKRALRALADSEHLIRSLVEHSSNGILRFARDDQDSDRRFRCTFANRAAERYLHGGNSTLVGMPLEKLELLEPERLQSQFGDATDNPSGIGYETMAEGEACEIWLRVVGEPVGSHFSVTLIDITQRKRNENKILADALRDPLTGVLNRRGFEKEAGECISTSTQGAVL
jgi:PAS domain S-box-containing protein